VDFVDPLVQVPARTILVKARVPNRGRLLKPGMFVEVRLVAEVRVDAIVVPEDAILPLEGEDYVWVVTEGTVTRQPVVLGVRKPGFVEVRDGLAVGDHVVVGGLQRLFEGAPVTPIPVER
jgi:membrane fusion protein (multidrug efflux system)